MSVNYDKLLLSSCLGICLVTQLQCSHQQPVNFLSSLMTLALPLLQLFQVV